MYSSPIYNMRTLGCCGIRCDKVHNSYDIQVSFSFPLSRLEKAEENPQLRAYHGFLGQGEEKVSHEPPRVAGWLGLKIKLTKTDSQEKRHTHVFKLYMTWEPS